MSGKKSISIICLIYFDNNTEKHHVSFISRQRNPLQKNQIMVGSESAGDGLCAAVCMMARDRGEVHVAYQMPLYPMLDNLDTKSSANNHGKVWNTRKNHIAWKLYLRKNAKKNVSPYAAPARQTDYSNLPPAYTFVGSGEPFFTETCTFIQNLRTACIEAKIYIYQSNMHAFDMLKPKEPLSKKAAQKFNQQFEYAMKHYFAENKKRSLYTANTTDI